MKLKLSLCLLTIIGLIGTTCPRFYGSYPQSYEKSPVVIPPSPAAAAFQQFDFSNIELYTGLPNVNIPIYELKVGSFTYNLNLHYSYSGFKVGDIAGWMGLGWNINAGGMISRIVRGKPDESVFGYSSIRNTLNLPDPINDPTGYTEFVSNLRTDTLSMRYFAYGTYDGMPDDYVLNALSLSGSIIKLNNGDYVTNPYKHNFIYKSGEKNWYAIDESGNQYFFGPSDYSDYALERTTYETETLVSYYSNWFLRRILTNTGDTINFNYEPEIIERPDQVNDTKYRLVSLRNDYTDGIPDSRTWTSFNNTTTWRLCLSPPNNWT